MRVIVALLMFIAAAVTAQIGATSPAMATPAPVIDRQVVVGGNHSCVLDVDASIRCWGLNSSGQLGIGSTTNRGDGPGEMGRNLPRVDLGTGRVPVSLALGSAHTCALLASGEVVCWGDSALGQLGRGSLTDRGTGPGQMGNNLPVVALGSGAVATQLVAAGDRSCVILLGGSVKCWGSNFSGSLGLGDILPRGDGPNEMGDALPVVDLGTGAVAVELAMGEDFSCALLADGSVKCWGINSSGQLGRGDTVPAIGDALNEMGNALVAARLGPGVVVSSIAAGFAHWCAVDLVRAVRCIGENSSGQLGLGDPDNRGRVPALLDGNLPVVALPTGRTVAQLVMGNVHTCARFTSGELGCWGAAVSLGVGATQSRGDGVGEMGDNLLLVNLGSGRTAVQIDASLHTCVVRDDRETVCFGRGAEGQLGNGLPNAIGDGAGEMGDALVVAALPPHNDDVASAQTLSGDRGSVRGLNASATQESTEPQESFFQRASIWYRWTAPDSGPVQFLTSRSTFSTELGVYTGSGLGSLSEVAFVAAGTLVEFDAVAGTEYRISVASASSDTGLVVLDWRPTPPLSDAFASAQAISGADGTITVDTSDATDEPEEPPHANLIPFRSIWLTWTAPRGGRVMMTTSVNSFDTVIAVYSGGQISGLETVAANDDTSTGLDSKVVFTAAAGATYSIAVSGAARQSGVTNLTWRTAALCAGRPTTVALAFGDTPTAGNDVILGTGAGETIDAGGGNDTVCAGGGNDTVRGGLDNDVLFGEAGNDSLVGEAGTDTLVGGANDDVLDGGPGNDSLDGGVGLDRLIGGSEADRLAGGTENDVLDGGPGIDSLDGGVGDDRLIGGIDADRLVGGTGRDTLAGGAGPDRLDGGTDRDVCNGNAGTDTARRCEVLRGIP